MVEVLSSANFEQKTGDGTVVVDFFADWCGPCKRLGPIFEELSGEIKEVKFFKVNVDEANDLAARFGVQSIPTVIVLKNGQQVERVMGLMPKDDLKEVITPHIK